MLVEFNDIQTDFWNSGWFPFGFWADFGLIFRIWTDFWYLNWFQNLDWFSDLGLVFRSWTGFSKFGLIFYLEISPNERENRNSQAREGRTIRIFYKRKRFLLSWIIKSLNWSWGSLRWTKKFFWIKIYSQYDMSSVSWAFYWNRTWWWLESTMAFTGIGIGGEYDAYGGYKGGCYCFSLSFKLTSWGSGEIWCADNDQGNVWTLKFINITCTAWPKCLRVVRWFWYIFYLKMRNISCRMGQCSTYMLLYCLIPT